MAVELSSVIRRFEVGGIAIVYVNPSAPEFKVPAPIQVPFEPTELDETHPAMEPLCELSWPTDEVGRGRPRAARARRLVIRVVVPVVGVILGAIYMFLDFGKTGTLFANLMVLFFMVLVMLAILGALLWQAGRWFVVPGGVVVRRVIVGPFAWAPRLYTPRNSILFIEYAWPGWEATIAQGYRRINRSLTDVECAVLLAAWQSPREPPDLDELFETR
jgi:hypothetical protein